MNIEDGTRIGIGLAIAPIIASIIAWYTIIRFARWLVTG